MKLPLHECCKTPLLTHWGRVTHICISKLTIIGSDNGLSPGRRQAIIWTNAGILLIRPLGTNFNEMLIEIRTFSFMKMHLKVSSGKWRPFCLGLNVLISQYWQIMAWPRPQVVNNRVPTGPGNLGKSWNFKIRFKGLEKSWNSVPLYKGPWIQSMVLEYFTFLALFA